VCLSWSLTRASGFRARAGTVAARAARVTSRNPSPNEARANCGCLRAVFGADGSVEAPTRFRWIPDERLRLRLLDQRRPLVGSATRSNRRGPRFVGRGGACARGADGLQSSRPRSSCTPRADVARRRAGLAAKTHEAHRLTFAARADRGSRGGRGPSSDCCATGRRPAGERMTSAVQHSSKSVCPWPHCRLAQLLRVIGDEDDDRAVRDRVGERVEHLASRSDHRISPVVR